MKRILTEQVLESNISEECEPAWYLKRKLPLENPGMRMPKAGKGNSHGLNHCGQCGNEVKIFVSPKRNPHSSKLGRAVTMKDHDLCRRCWRQLMYQQRTSGVFELPLSMVYQGGMLRPRLLVPLSYALPREAS